MTIGAKSGNLHQELGECIPSYENHDWNEQRKQLAENIVDLVAMFRKLVFQFYQVAAAHRVSMLRDLLLCQELLSVKQVFFFVVKN